jgi:hypothetical protein
VEVFTGLHAGSARCVVLRLALGADSIEGIRGHGEAAGG